MYGTRPRPGCVCVCGLRAELLRFAQQSQPERLSASARIRIPAWRGQTYFAVVSDEECAVPRVNRGRAEVALFDTHGGGRDVLAKSDGYQVSLVKRCGRVGGPWL